MSNNIGWPYLKTLSSKIYFFFLALNNFQLLLCFIKENCTLQINLAIQVVPGYRGSGFHSDSLTVAKIADTENWRFFGADNWRSAPLVRYVSAPGPDYRCQKSQIFVTRQAPKNRIANNRGLAVMGDDGISEE